MKAACYCRCSTSEKRQDISIQIKELERYCKASGWDFDVIVEFDSAYKGSQPKLAELLNKIRLKHYDILLVHSLDRFSRQHPAKINALLDEVVFSYGCRFLAIQQSIDSNNPLIWNAVKPLFTFFANQFSQNLSEKIRLGIKRSKEKGQYVGGRPAKYVNMRRFKSLKEQLSDSGYRKLAAAYNQGVSKKLRISPRQVLKVRNKLTQGLPR